MDSKPLATLEPTRLHDEADRRCADQAAMPMWEELDAVLAKSSDQAGRAARRFAQRLQHHRQHSS